MNIKEWIWKTVDRFGNSIVKVAHKRLNLEEIAENPYTKGNQGCYTQYVKEIDTNKVGCYMYSAINIADYIIANYPRDDMTNLKLQKLLYFAQGYYLAKTGRPLFIEDILAWKYGPVVREVYKKFNSYVSLPIKKPSSDDVIKLDKENNIEAYMIIEKVMSQYGDKSAGELVSITHAQAPWMETMEHYGIDSVIPKEDILDFFKSNNI